MSLQALSKFRNNRIWPQSPPRFGKQVRGDAPMCIIGYSSLHILIHEEKRTPNSTIFSNTKQNPRLVLFCRLRLNTIHVFPLIPRFKDPLRCVTISVEFSRMVGDGKTLSIRAHVPRIWMFLPREAMTTKEYMINRHYRLFLSVRGSESSEILHIFIYKT